MSRSMYRNWIPALRSADVATTLANYRSQASVLKRATPKPAKSDRDQIGVSTAAAPTELINPAPAVA